MEETVDYPASFSQERVWVLSHLEPDARAYQFQATLTFEGELDAVALERSLRALVQRHEGFRTTFPAVDGHPVQRVHPDAPCAVPLLDLSDLPEAQAEARLRAAVEDELARPFDIEELPLVRWSLVRLRPDKHVLTHVEHHLVHDGWSFYIFLDELATLYRAFANGGTASLPPIPLSFGEVAARQRAAEAHDAFAGQLEFWRARLAGAPPVLQLPADRTRPTVQSYNGGSVWIELPQALRTALGALGRQAGCTPFMTMFAAFATLLHRYTGETDLCIGTGVAARSPEAERAIGMLVNNVTLRSDLSGDPTFADLLARIRSTTLDAYANQDVPFDRVVEAVHPVRDRAVHPLYSVMFSFHDSPPPDLTIPGAKVTLTQALDNDTAKFDLNVIAIPHGGGLTLRFEYNRDLFDHETILALAGHYRRLLEAIADEPERRISRLPLMSESERRQVTALSGSRVPYERDASIGELFARQAARTPSAVALEGEGVTLTYAELDARANRLANHLRALGVGAETPVGIALERGVHVPIALLAVLKAGGAYVPLEASHPRERLAFILRDSGVRTIVTERTVRAGLPAEGAFVVSLDEDAAAIAGCSAAAPPNSAGPDSLAYIMYTSGSTGTPKGVAVVQRGVVRLARGADYVDIAPDDVFLQLAPLGFDASTFEFWAPLLNGARLALAPAGTRGWSELGTTLERFGVTTLWLTAALFHELVDTDLERLGGLRRLLTGGDVVSPIHARRFLERFPNVRLINGYGPTENTTFSSCYTVPSAAEIGANLPIGRAIANSSAYVLDARRQPQPLGVPGELFVGGDGLARGYVNAPELTAERFIPDPFSEDPAARLYRTGDRARFRRDGALEFLGRLDQQIKIRGFRIEPGEIEAVLRAHGDVREAAVTVAENGGERSLVGLVQPVPGAHLDESLIRAYLRAKLPEYMVPARIAVLEHLPAHASGKLDRAALPQVAPATPASGEDARPQGPVEATLAALLAELLARDAVGRNDDIFSLGAHSLLAMRIVARITQKFGIELALRELFDHPTVAQLARRIDAAPRRGATAPNGRAQRRGAPTLTALAERLAKRP
jgi:amino acid adenylation domain-containing protein